MSRTFAVRTVLFDLDGTLADTAPDLSAVLNRMRIRRGLEAMPFAALRPVGSAGARGMLRVGLQCTPDHADYKAARQEFLAEYEAALNRDSRLFDGVAQCLVALKDRGIAWGVVTNKVERCAVPVMAGLGLSAGAAVLICGDTTAFAKPHPAPLLEACARLGIAPDHAVYVGDDLRDVQAAHAAGMPAIVAAYGYLGEAPDLASWQADACIDGPMELMELLA